LQDSIATLSAFKKVYDTKAGVCAPYLQLVHTIVIQSITEHSKRASSEKVHINFVAMSQCFM